MKFPRRSKYGAKATTVDGIRFPSLREARRWSQLRLLEKAGTVTGLRRQVRYQLAVKGVHVCTYVADFVYEEAGAVVVEDCKGYRTDVYKLKKKLMKAIHGVEIRET